MNPLYLIAYGFHELVNLVVHGFHNVGYGFHELVNLVVHGFHNVVVYVLFCMHWVQISPLNIFSIFYDF